jgi:hypothetical protein
VRLLRHILITVIVTLALVFVGLNWVAPVAASFYAAKKAPAVARIVPIDLKERSVSDTPVTKLSYLGYEFELPWSDLDETRTTLYPKDKPGKTKVDLHFRSGLRLVVSAHSPREWVNQLPTELSVSPQDLDSAFGRETMKSDYSFSEILYEFTPDKMNHWAFFQSGLNRDEFLLIIKSMALSKSAETGIFRVQNQSYKGFQEGNPLIRQDAIEVRLFSDEDGVEMLFFQKDYKKSAGVTQPEINRIVQSLHKAQQNETASPLAQK